MSIQIMKADVMGQRVQDVDEKLLFVMFSACLCYSLMGQSSGIWEWSLTLVLVIMGMVFAMALSIMLWKPNNALSSNSWASKPGFWEAYYHLTGLLGCGIIISYCHLWAKGLWELWRLWRILNWATHEALFINLWLFWSFICHDWGNSAICVGCYAMLMHYWCFDVLVDWLCGCIPLLLFSPCRFCISVCPLL
jgi:hypothetical protein